MSTYESSRLSLRILAAIRNGRHLVRVDDAEILLTNSCFLALLMLVSKRLNSVTGYTTPRDFGHALDKPVLHTTIRRLRRAFDAALGLGVGAQLISHVGFSHYELRFETEQIVIDPALNELVPFHIPQTLADDLLPHTNVCQKGASELSVATFYDSIAKRPQHKQTEGE